MNSLTLNTDYIIRTAVQADIDNILKIENLSFGANHWNKNTFKQEFQNNISTYYVVELISGLKKIIGYTGYWKIDNEGHIVTMSTHAA